MSTTASGIGQRLAAFLDAAPGVVQEQASAVWAQAYDIWVSGGWAMIAIAIVALVMFGVGTQLHLRLRAKGFQSVSEDVWRRWIDRPAEREGPIGDLLDRVTDAGSVEDMARRFEELRTSETRPFERDLRVMKTCVSAAPLVGLLGTVTGMLSTFAALASGSGGDKTMALVAKGISEALITTETGLVVALPGMFFQYQLARRHDRYGAFLAHLESVCNQTLHRRLGRERRAAAKQSARRRIAQRLAAELRARGTVARATAAERAPTPPAAERAPALHHAVADPTPS